MTFSKIHESYIWLKSWSILIYFLNIILFRKTQHWYLNVKPEKILRFSCKSFYFFSKSLLRYELSYDNSSVLQNSKKKKIIRWNLQPQRFKVYLFLYYFVFKFKIKMVGRYAIWQQRNQKKFKKKWIKMQFTRIVFILAQTKED